MQCVAIHAITLLPQYSQIFSSISLPPMFIKCLCWNANLEFSFSLSVSLSCHTDSWFLLQNKFTIFPSTNWSNDTDFTPETQQCKNLKECMSVLVAKATHSRVEAEFNKPGSGQAKMSVWVPIYSLLPVALFTKCVCGKYIWIISHKVKGVRNLSDAALN